MRFVTAIITCFLIIGCLQTATRYPAELSGLNNSKSFPLKAGHFSRGKMFMLSKDSFSVSYFTSDELAPIEATFYFYTKNNELDEQFQKEMLAIEQIHKSAVLISSQNTTLEKNGKKIPAKMAMYKFMDEFRNKHQELYSILLLTENKVDFVKLRSTSPMGSMNLFEEMNNNLLNEINWAP